MPFIQRYTDVKKGGITFAGNTLGLSKAPNQNAPGAEGSIGAFTSLNTALQVGTFPAGTTLDYAQNGSRANLTLPARLFFTQNLSGADFSVHPSTTFPP